MTTLTVDDDPTGRNWSAVRSPRTADRATARRARHPSRTEQPGRTVDTTPRSYVEPNVDWATATTRGRTATHLYVENDPLLLLDAERPPAPIPYTMDELVAVLSRETGERTATLKTPTRQL